MKIIEFIIKTSDLPNTFSPIFIDANDISSINRINELESILITKTNNKFHLIGNVVQLTNRWLYVLEKRVLHLNDHIIRPSLLALYDPTTIECDVAHFDPAQLAGLLIAYNKLDILPKLQEYTEQEINKILDLINFKKTL